jgi:hypothetical protein
MKIVGLDGLSHAEIDLELQRGARFVIYQYCVSVLIMSFKRPSDIYFIRSGQSAAVKGLIFTLLSILVGWWGIPWGPIWTVQSIWINAHGGRDVTREVLASLGTASAAPVPSAPAP